MFLLVSFLLFLAILGWSVFSDLGKVREVSRALNAARGFEPPVYRDVPPLPQVPELTDIETAIARLRGSSSTPLKTSGEETKSGAVEFVSAPGPLEAPAGAPATTPEESTLSSGQPVAAPESRAPGEPAAAVEPPLLTDSVPIAAQSDHADAVTAGEELRKAPATSKLESVVLTERVESAAQSPPPMEKTEPVAETQMQTEAPEPAARPKVEGRVLEVRAQPEEANAMPPENVARLLVEELFRAGFSTQLQESVAGADIWVKRPGDARHSIKITVGTGGATQPTYGIGTPLGEAVDPENPMPGHIVVQLPGLPRRS